ncbi:M20 metallopeptidase family protein [Antricoccus suffuscus]|uniref:M20 metallopeptidase family protein n=1 Tax=Antricoccus suffuscus TaxID=1629062 RepID=UPI000D04C20C|nr:M20 family metallopeptidase [Antricoccus suffuscus]
MNLKEDAQSLQEDLVQVRRSLHREPEIGLQLPRTQERVLKELQGLPLEVSVGKDTTSVTAVLRGGARSDANPTTVLLRGDMDALPVDELTGLDFAAENGAMHACGHDLHTTALIGGARLLSQHRDALKGDVVFMFQPGEEGHDGAGVMIAEGVLDAAGKRADFAYGLHVISNQSPQGVFASRPQTVMSAAHNLDVTVLGAGGHGSAPHGAKDPVPAAAEMITALQTMVTRVFNIFDPVVVTVGYLRAGSIRNVIPDTATFQATVRAFSNDASERLHEVIPPLIRGIAAAHGLDVDVRFEVQYPATINDVDEVAFSQQLIQALMGEERYAELPQPVSGSEDFSRVIAEVPGAFIFLGACMADADPHKAAMNHSPRAQFDDHVLADAAAVYAALAVARLDKASQ